MRSAVRSIASAAWLRGGGCGTFYCRDNVIQCFGCGHNLLGQSNTEHSFDAEKQFHAFQAAESKFPIKMRGAAHCGDRVVAAEFVQQLARDLQHCGFNACTVELSNGSRHGGVICE